MPEFDGVTTFRKSGFRRLRDAIHLLTPPVTDIAEQGAETRHTRGAMYLCGYGVECMLKAYLIHHHSPCQRLSDVLIELRKSDPEVRDICGVAGHDLPYLLKLTKLEEHMDNERKRQMSLCAKWRSNWRYNPQPAPYDDAVAMVEAARLFAKWIDKQI